MHKSQEMNNFSINIRLLKSSLVRCHEDLRRLIDVLAKSWHCY